MVEQKIRKDVYIYNEATGFVITSGNRNYRSDDDFQTGEPTWEAAINDGSFLPIQLVQDDSLVLRVLVNDDLTEEEESEWVDRFEWKLALPDGKLVVASGIEYMWGEEMDGEYIKTLDVEPGLYKLELYTLLPGVNGGHCLGLEDGEHEAYFKKTRPGGPMPEWMYDWLDLDEADETDIDEDDEEYFEDDEDDLVHDPSKKPAAYIDFILRLTPLTEKPQRPKLDDGWIAVVQNPRKPEKCPVGILAPHVVGIHDQPVYIRTDLHYRADIWPVIEPYKPSAIAGGAVQLPIQDLALPYWIAWMCSHGVFVALTLDTKGQAVPFEWPELLDDVLVTEDDGTFKIELDGMNAKWAQPPRLRKLGELFAALPNGSQLEMVTAEEEDEDEDEQTLAGLHRYRGEVANGIWTIAETFPQLDKATLEDALGVAREVDGHAPISFKSEDELIRVEQRFLTNDFLLREDPPVREGLALRCVAEPSYGALVGSWLLRERYPHTWPYLDLDDELDEWDSMMDMIEQKFAAPTTGEVILEGVAGKFTVGNMLSVNTVSQDETFKHDKQMLELGFAHVGDLVCSKFSDVVLRGYAHASEPVYGVMLRNTLGGGGSDFYSLFEDGWSLTTSTIPQSADLAVKKLVQVADDLASGWEMHKNSLKDLESEHGSPVQQQKTLLGLTGALDEFLQRTT